MNITILSTMILCICLFATCNKGGGQIPQSIIDEVAYISSVPDSLLSPKQLSGVISILTIIKETTKIEGNKLITTASAKDFKQKGLSKDYYNFLLKNIEEMNLAGKDFFLPNSINQVYDNMMSELEERLATLTAMSKTHEK